MTEPETTFEEKCVELMEIRYQVSLLTQKQIRLEDEIKAELDRRKETEK